MNNSLSSLARALRGPVLLITVGLLFAFDQMLNWSFSSTWPVLIIVLGAMKLLESVAPKTPTTPPSTPANPQQGVF